MADIAKISIPQQFVSGIRYLSILSEDEINLVYDALRQIPKGLSRKKYLKSFEELYTLNNSFEIGSAIFSFGGLLMDGESKVEDIATGLINSFGALDEGEASSEILERLKERLRFILLLSENLKIIFEVYDLLQEGSNFIHSDISTQTHLMFDGTDPQSKYGVIFHRLKIEFKDEDKNFSKVFSLDKDDLRKLKFKIEAAMDKEDNIRLSNANLINFIEVSE